MREYECNLRTADVVYATGAFAKCQSDTEDKHKRHTHTRVAPRRLSSMPLMRVLLTSAQSVAWCVNSLSIFFGSPPLARPRLTVLSAAATKLGGSMSLSCR